MGALGQRYLHTIITNFLLKLVVGLAISVVTARALGPSGRGEYNLVVLVITLMTTLLNFGIPASNTYFVAQKKIGKEKLLKASFLIAVAVSLLSFVLLYVLFSFGLLKYLFPVETLTPAAIASLAIIPVVFFNLFAQGIIVGENKIYLNNYIYLASQTCLAVTLTVAYLLGFLSVSLSIVLFAVSNFVAFAIIVFSYRSIIFTPSSSAMGWGEYKQVFGFSIVLQAGNIIQFFNYRLDTFLVNIYLGTMSVGLYVLAVNLVEILWILSSSMASVLLPTVAGKHEFSKKIAVKAAIASFAVTLGAGILALPLAPYAITFLFGKEFAGSIMPFFILLPGVTLFSITNVLAAYMTGVGKPGFNTGIALVALVFTILLDIALIPRFGISGAAFASSVSYTILTLLSLWIFVRLSGLTWAECIEFARSFKDDLRSMRNRAGLKLRTVISTNRTNGL